MDERGIEPAPHLDRLSRDIFVSIVTELVNANVDPHESDSVLIEGLSGSVRTIRAIRSAARSQEQKNDLREGLQESLLVAREFARELRLPSEALNRLCSLQ